MTSKARAAADPDSAESPSEDFRDQLPPVILRTLLSLIVTGITVSAWILFYTDWFPYFTGLVTLSGAFVWIGFVGGLLTDARKEQLQAAFERFLLGRPRAWWLTPLVVLPALTLATWAGGTVIVDSVDDAQHRALTIRPERTGLLSDVLTVRTSLPSRTRRTFYLWHFGLYRDYRLELTGLPSRRVRPRVVGREKVIVPGDLYLSPIVLLRLNQVLGDQVRQGDRKLAIFLDDRLLTQLDPYDGKAIWMGDPLAVPEELRSGPSSKQLLPLRSLMATPQGQEIRLEPGDRLRFQLAPRACKTLSNRSCGCQENHTVKEVTGSMDYIQEVVLANTTSCGSLSN